MPATRNGSSLCRKRTREQSANCEDCSHLAMIEKLKREIVGLENALHVERERRIEALRERPPLTTAGVSREDKHAAVECNVVESTQTKTGMGHMTDSHRHTVYELELCKKELEYTREALREACEEQDALRVKLSLGQTATKVSDSNKKDVSGDCNSAEDSHPHLDWVGRHYLAVSLPDDRMFTPGQSVTPVGVLHKLFEMRVGDKLSTGFSVLLENINIMLSQLEPEWYAKHFGFCRAHVHGNMYKSTDRVDTEDFAWLLFEYGAHAPLIEVLAGLLNVLNSTGKGGVTNGALYTSKIMYSSYVTMFRDTVSRAYDGFASVRERALRVRKAQGLVYVPLTAGLGVTHNEPQRGSHSVRNRVLLSVLEGIEAPPHISSTSAIAKVDGVCREDPLGLQQSLSEFMKRRDLASKSDKGRACGPHGNQSHVPFQPMTSSGILPGPLEKRVLFDSPWSKESPLL